MHLYRCDNCHFQGVFNLPYLEIACPECSDGMMREPTVIGDTDDT